jgi:acyl-CoA thioesterase-1
VGCRLQGTPKGKDVDTRRVIRCATFADRWWLIDAFAVGFAVRRAGSIRRALLPGLILAALAAPPVWAETPCPIPDAMALRDISLPAARQEVATDQRLIVLTFGGVRLAGADAEIKGATWPARLQAALSAALPEIQVTVANEPAPGKTSAAVPPALPGLIAKTGARVVIWGPGGRDVMAHLDLEAFQTAVNSGIEAVRHGGADLILLDTTFVPAPTRMVQIEPYRDRLLAAATANDVPVLRRHGLMRLWGEDGTLNLGARDPAEREAVVRHLYSCVAQGLAEAIAAAVR